jgi:hypothetical protein
MEFITMLVELGFTPLNILLVVMLYLVLANQGVVPKLWKGDGIEHIPDWAEQLMQHFNHDTTDQHNLTHAKLDRIESKVDRHNEYELANSGKLDEIIRNISR